MAAPLRPRRQPDYAAMPCERALVLDNGAYACRVGWAGEADPRFSFRNVLNKPRHRATGEVVSIVGNYDPELAKLFDFTRSSLRTPFDANVVYHFDIMETILDYALERMGVNESEIDHPVLMTECPCNPCYSRSKMAELLFETYGVPSVAFGIGGVFSYKHNQRLGLCEATGMVICSSHMASNCIPMVRGEPIIGSSCRTSVGGYHVTDFLRQLFCLQHPYHAFHPNGQYRLTSSASVLWENMESVKQEYCYVAEDYSEELRSFANGGDQANETTKWWQVPWACAATPIKEKEQVDEEELARKAAIKEKQGQRLREMAAAKRSAKICHLEGEMQELERLIDEMDGADGGEVAEILGLSGYATKQEVQARHTKVSASLKKLKGEQVEAPPKEHTEVSLTEKYPLLDIPDGELTEEQLKEKKKQKFLKITADGRARAKQKREEEGLQKQFELQLEEERRLANPEQYLEELRMKHSELGAKIQQRKKPKTGGLANSVALTTGAGGRGERLTAVQKERMKLLTTAAFDRGKEEDTFGMKDEDWLLYKRMGREDTDEIEEEETEYSRLTSRLKELDPSFLPADEIVPGMQPAPQDHPQQRQPSEASYRIPLGVERFRCPEILFQPSMIGVDQAGIGEAVCVSVRRLPQDLQAPVVQGSLLLTGGNSLLPGYEARICAELRQCRPLGSHIKVVRSSDPLLDAWRGASTFASSSSFKKHTFTKADYEELGPDWLRKYHLRYS